MERKDSQSRERRYEEAVEGGYATKCIGRKCVCWWYCSHNNSIKVPMCTSDLTTGFYKRREYRSVLNEEMTSEKPKKPRSKVFDRDYQRRKRRLRERETL